MKPTTDTPLNPWFSLWTRPRQTMQQIIDTDPEKLVFVLASLAGVMQGLNQAMSGHLGDRFEYRSLLLGIAFLAPLLSILGLFLGGLVLRWTGSLLGGKATQLQVRAALAWGNVPLLWTLPLWLILLGTIGPELFMAKKPLLESTPAHLALFAVVGIAQMVAAVWSLITMLKCIGQVHGFSAWKALGSLLIAALLLALPLLLAIGIGGLPAVGK